MKYLAQREGVSGSFSFSPSLRGQHRRRFLRGVRGAPPRWGQRPPANPGLGPCRLATGCPPFSATLTEVRCSPSR